MYLSGDVTTGFGRGSKQMGVPTANLPPAPLQVWSTPICCVSSHIGMPSGASNKWPLSHGKRDSPCWFMCHNSMSGKQKCGVIPKGCGPTTMGSSSV